MGIKSNVTSAIRTETFKNLQLNAGLTLINFSLDGYSSADALKAAIASEIASGAKLLGATRDGGSFVITRDIRQVTADGIRSRFKGSEIVDSADAYLSETLIEITPEHIKSVLGNADIDTTDPNHVKVTVRVAIDDGDYLDNIVWIGDTSEGFVAIELYNGLNTADFTFTFTDKNEGTATAEFHAHQDDVNDNEAIPVVMHFFYPTASPDALTISSATGTNVGGTKITKSYTLKAGEKFVYKVGNSAPSISYNAIADYTWTEWDGSSDIDVGAAANGKKITVAVVNGYGRAQLSGNCTLVVKTA